jgi:hypothetical protein
MMKIKTKKNKAKIFNLPKVVPFILDLRTKTPSKLPTTSMLHDRTTRKTKTKHNTSQKSHTTIIKSHSHHSNTNQQTIHLMMKTK